jgi:hypothetical protein
MLVNDQASKFPDSLDFERRIDLLRFWRQGVVSPIDFDDTALAARDALKTGEGAPQKRSWILFQRKQLLTPRGTTKAADFPT